MKKQILCLVTALALGAGSAYAGCVDTFGVGAKASAMGGAYSAYADDPFAVYYNPAGLTQIDRTTLAGGVHMVDPSIKLKGVYVEGITQPPEYIPTTKEKAVNFSDTSENLYAPALGFAMPLSERLVLGFAAYAPFGLEVEFPNDPKVNPSAYSSFHSYYFREVISPTIAYKISDQLSFGFGVSIGKTKSGAEKYYYLGKAQNISTGGLGALHNAHLKIELEDELNYSYNIGAMYKPTDTLSIGLTYRSETDVDFEGDAYLNGIKVAKATLDYNHPQQVQAGVRYAPHSRFSIEMDVVWTNWAINENQIEPLTAIPTAPIQLPVNVVKSERRWENTRQLRFGGEYAVTDIVTLRAGYFYDPTPIPDDTLDTMWPDADKKTYSIGAGLNFTKVVVDLVFQYTDIEQTRMIGGESVNLNKAFEGAGSAALGLTSDPTRVHAKAEGNILGAGITVSYKF